MTISVDDIKRLRADTGAGMMDCRKALTDSNGDFDGAVVFLRKKGLADIKGRGHKATSEGVVGSYIHTGSKLGVLVSVDCETDFASKSDDFQMFVKDLAMHVAAANPQWVRREDVSQDIIDRETEIVSVGLDGKPDNIIEKIVSGRLNKFYKDTCLMEQAWIKDPNLTITDLLGNVASQIKENIVVKRFARFVAGE